MAGEVAAHAAEVAAHGGIDLVQIAAILGAGVIAVPLFRRLGLGSVLGYLAAGLVLGPFGLKVVSDPQSVLHAAELGVVLFLFIVGLEMEPAKLWGLRKEIFGLGVLQVGLCGAVLTLAGVFLLGLTPAVAFVAGLGFVLTSTAIVMQILAERGELQTPDGQKIVSVLLLEDLAIVPLLAAVALISPGGDADVSATQRWISVGVAVASIVAVIFAGRWVLNPVFKLLAESKAREVMTAAALLVVLGAALIMELGGLSMAMGAFMAGVLLSTSTFRHQLEADVEPFRGLLLGLFFLAVGMALDLRVVAANWQFIALAVLTYMLLKGAVIYGLARLLGGSNQTALERAVLMAQGGEFAFVLYTTATASGLLSGELSAIFTATVIISMALTPFSTMLLKFLPKPARSLEGVEKPEGLTGNVLMIGFGRFGQIASQPLIAKGQHSISIIDNDVEMIEVAQTFGFKIYYGDGTRLDILRAAGAGTADLVLVCVDKKEAATRIVELVKSEFPLAKVFARSFDRGHSLELVKAGVDYQLRELFESSLEFGAETLRALGVDTMEVDEIIEKVRENDRQRFSQQMVGGIMAGRELLIANAEDQARESGTVAGPSEPIIAPEGEQEKA
ncbi:monovalent cation:proton antiporter-2 (CPA2) family protein [Devosia sp. ZB163]|uniref:monovalent cation:proton antiporter-2 (CPA2) family protein n=1 Tax=Devosia sp. ZB163 TaxID=3025938 RepID=UPI00235F70DE|nr:monovalent cation:proton antiporter-2 (CPA2) family protein [Devosia sp. ZB163]MDC9825855.1 monovalent cation:proton antiporter-2 (CPA2) family protein [Devosia sp. ZB163]